VDPHLLISPDLAAFLESGLPITVATRNSRLEPDGAWAWGARVHEDRRHLTVYLRPESAAALLENLTDHPEIALVFDRPIDHRACQVKGRFLSFREACADERAVLDRQVDGVRRHLADIGIPEEMTAAWCWWPCVSFEIEVTHLFEQTPGPGAGEPLR
jgi:hypothetical protein